MQLNGLEIGSVEELTFVLKSYDLHEGGEGVSEYDQYIRVIFSINEGAVPRRDEKGRDKRMKIYLKQGLRLRLASNIITGQAYLEALILDPERFPIMEVPWTPQYPYIPSAPSTFSTMQDSFDQILEKLEKIDFKSAVDNFSKTLETIEQTVVDANVKGLSENADAFIHELRQSNKDLQALIGKPDSQKELANIPVLIARFDHTLSQLDQLIAREAPGVQEIIENIRQLSEDLSYLIEQLKDNPSRLFFSEPPPKPEK